MRKKISLNTKKAFRLLFVLSIKTLTDLQNALFSELHFPANKVVCKASIDKSLILFCYTTNQLGKNVNLHQT